ncbi:diguanylate cyclase (GGDEF) domain-containing protein [Altererythrobacter xiamenensis]|uniref:diguanylate cyclase n=1 Tax=Altererythrobacter xiamenensis TaxID=1316679 RepID=A0A1Y6FTH8_9SPHN|nr:GGDEF domain-containing protein [Altererythrobacter xiamenensis]SMQ75823.1 diguanylate cyclase (GGDEF) domain-containing protein [Altererythrobacter xiamenensis]
METGPPTVIAASLRADVDAALRARARYYEWPEALQAAHEDSVRAETFRSLRFQLVMGLLVSVCALLFDALVMPGHFDLSLGWRMLTTLPLTLVALLALRDHQLGLIKLAVAVSMTCFGMLEVHLASHAEPEIMARYTMGTAFLLAISCLALPLKPRELARFALGYGLATSLVGMWPNPLPAHELALHMSFTLLAVLPCWAMAQRHWQVSTRGFLLDLREEASRLELEHNIAILRELSERDSLTGLPNRRAFRRIFSEAYERSLPGETNGVSLMMIDLDLFKEFNDNFGHPAGDRALRTVARTLQHAFHDHGGHVARYGGEEFVGALRCHSAAEAEKLAWSICEQLRELPITVRRQEPQTITASIGLASVGFDAEVDLANLTARADRALYHAKKNGRDRVVVSERIELRVDKLATG